MPGWEIAEGQAYKRWRSSIAVVKQAGAEQCQAGKGGGLQKVCMAHNKAKLQLSLMN